MTGSDSSSAPVMMEWLCPLCGSDKNALAFKAIDNWRSVAQWNGHEFRYVSCKHCQLVYLNPKATPESLAQYYGENYISHTSAQGFDPSSAEAPPIIDSGGRKVVSFLSMVKEWMYLNRWSGGGGASRKKRMFLSLLKSIRSINAEPLFFFGRGKIALDYGCGIGGYVNSMKANGWRSIGFDLSKRAVAKAVGYSGVIAGVSNAENIPLKNDSVDVVTMNHVLEHLENPAAVVKDVFRILKPGGAFMLSVPNAASAAMAIEKKYWIGADAPRHIVIWSPASISRLITECGFTIDWMYNISSTSSFTAAIEFWLRNKGYNIKRDKIRKSALLGWLFFPLVRALDALSLGDNLRIVATKN